MSKLPEYRKDETCWRIDGSAKFRVLRQHGQYLRVRQTDPWRKKPLLVHVNQVTKKDPSIPG